MVHPRRHLESSHCQRTWGVDILPLQPSTSHFTRWTIQVFFLHPKFDSEQPHEIHGELVSCGHASLQLISHKSCQLTDFRHNSLTLVTGAMPCSYVYFVRCQVTDVFFLFLFKCDVQMKRGWSGRVSSLGVPTRLFRDKLRSIASIWLGAKIGKPQIPLFHSSHFKDFSMENLFGIFTIFRISQHSSHCGTPRTPSIWNFFFRCPRCPTIFRHTIRVIAPVEAAAKRRVERGRSRGENLQFDWTHSLWRGSQHRWLGMIIGKS